jgi:hypothetical protein
LKGATENNPNEKRLLKRKTNFQNKLQTKQIRQQQQQRRTKEKK